MASKKETEVKQMVKTRPGDPAQAYRQRVLAGDENAKKLIAEKIKRGQGPTPQPELEAEAAKQAPKKATKKAPTKKDGGEDGGGDGGDGADGDSESEADGGLGGGPSAEFSRLLDSLHGLSVDERRALKEESLPKYLPEVVEFLSRPESGGEQHEMSHYVGVWLLDLDRPNDFLWAMERLVALGQKTPAAFGKKSFYDWRAWKYYDWARDRVRAGHDPRPLYIRALLDWGFPTSDLKRLYWQLMADLVKADAAMEDAERIHWLAAAYANGAQVKTVLEKLEKKQGSAPGADEQKAWLAERLEEVKRLAPLEPPELPAA